MAKQSNKSYDIKELRKKLLETFQEGLVVADHTETEHWYRNTKTDVRAASVTTKQNTVDKPYLKQWAVNRAVDHIEQNIQSILDGNVSYVFDAARSAHKNDLREAGGWGTKIHEAIDGFCQRWIDTGNKTGTSQDYLAQGASGQEVAGCRSFDKFKAEVEFWPVASELKVWYQKGKDAYAGTIDAILLVHSVYKEKEGDFYCIHDYAEQRPNILWCPRCGRTVKRMLVLGDWKSANTVSGKDEYAEQTVAYATAIEAGTGLKFDDIWIVRFSKEKAEYEIVRVSDRKRAWKRFLMTSRLFDARANTVPLLEPLNSKLIIKLGDYEPLQ